MANRSPFALDEWYHCYNRGVDKRRVFENARDYERFLIGMFVGNSDLPVHISNLKSSRLQDVLEDDSCELGDSLIEVGAYCLMPSHFHFLLREVVEGGIAKFMQKLCTGYTMYFNTKNERTGALFAGTFKSKHVSDDRYFKHLVSYFHHNPAELIDSKWKRGLASSAIIKKELSYYRYSSLPDFVGQKRVENSLVGKSLFDLYENVPTLSEVVEDSHEYYKEQFYQG